MRDQKVIVAGGGASGLNAALELASKGLNPVLISESEIHVYKNGLNRLIRNEKSIEDLSIDIEDFLEYTPIEFVKEEIKGFNPEEKALETSDEAYQYENLVLAIGNSMSETVPGIKYTENFYSGESAEDALGKIGEAEEIAVVGAGRKGIQIAGELNAKGVEVSLIDSSTRPLSRESSKVSKKIVSYFNKKNLSFRGASEVREITSYGMEFEDGSELDTDSIIWCGGLKAPAIVQENFSCDEDGINVNKGLSAPNFDGVYAVGGCADIEERSFSAAIRQGRHAAKNIASDSQLLEDYEISEKDLFSIGDTGVYLGRNSVYINRMIGKLIDVQARKYFIDLKKRRFLLRF